MAVIGWASTNFNQMSPEQRADKLEKRYGNQVAITVANEMLHYLAVELKWCKETNGNVIHWRDTLEILVAR